MAEKKRQCGTCRFFLEQDGSGRGKCGHPLRAGVEADLIMYRANELGCRSKWGTSYWQDVNDLSDPTAPETPTQPSLPEPVSIHAQFDDEVTSVSIADRRVTRPSLDDDVIDVGTTSRPSFAYAEGLQDERRELLSRSSHDALAAARKRHTDRITRQRELIPFADDQRDGQPEPTEQRDDTEADMPISAKDANGNAFPPDDFVEEERAASAEHAGVDDVVDEGVALGIRRSPRVRNLMSQRPKEPKAMTFSPALEIPVESNNPDNRGQWNSVPTISGGVDIPFKLSRDPRPASAARVVPSVASPVQAQPHPISTARDVLAEERRRSDQLRRNFRPPLAEDTTNDTDQDDDLFEDAPPPRVYRERTKASQPVNLQPTQPAMPPRENRVVEAKTSPLRGYAQELRAEAPTRRDNAPEHREAHPEPQMEGRERRPEPVQAPVERRQAESTRLRIAPVERRPEPRHSIDHALIMDRQFSLLDMSVEIAPDVPRSCGTCASYRANDRSGCGSCINRDANPEQGIVEEEGLACLSTIGTWWTPADEEVWLDEFHVNTTPTPRMDALLERLSHRRRAERSEHTILPNLDEFA